MTAVGRLGAVVAATALTITASLACESNPKPKDAPRAPSASTAARPSPSSAPGRSARGKLTPAVRRGWAELVGREPPDEFANDDEQRFYAKCLEFTRALHERASGMEDATELSSRDPDEPPALLRAVEAVQQKPPRMPKADLTWCATYTVQALKAQLAQGVARQAEMTLQAMAGAMVAAYERTGKLCPSTTEGVPAELEAVKRGPHTAPAEAWHAPTWRCMRFRWPRPLRFQYQVSTEATRFTLIARGSPAADGKIDEYRLVGELKNGTIELGEVTGRFLTDPLPAVALPPSDAP